MRDERVHGHPPGNRMGHGFFHLSLIEAKNSNLDRFSSPC
jgi:hypothetical protein